jgi:hypothetical protein
MTIVVVLGLALLAVAAVPLALFVGLFVALAALTGFVPLGALAVAAGCCRPATVELGHEHSGVKGNIGVVDRARGAAGAKERDDRSQQDELREVTEGHDGLPTQMDTNTTHTIAIPTNVMAYSRFLPAPAGGLQSQDLL